MTRSGRTLKYIVADVFTESPLQGNPLAVVMNTAGLATEEMQAIAREFNLSETAFVERRAAATELQEGVRVRIFTTEEELPFAGHPTLGTASVLKRTAPETVREGVVTLAENVGAIPVRFEAEDSLFAEMTQRDPEFAAELDPGEVARLCGLRVQDLDVHHAPQLVSTGNAFAIVLLQSVEALGRLNVNQDEATPWLRARGGRWFYAMAPDGSGGARSWRARMQFNRGEDPATGSAAGCAIAWMVARGLARGEERVHVRQGIEIHRPSDLFLTASVSENRKVTRVRVAGSSVIVAEGSVFLP
ncbi:MAG: PhzF family phenazine biosynthesis protein [Terracidiphilus sp.]